MNILELAGFRSNYGSNFIPTLENLDQNLTLCGHNTFYIFSNENLSDGFYDWEIPFSQKHSTTLVNFHSVAFIKEISRFIRKNKIDIVHAHFCSSIYLSQIKKLSPKNVAFYQQMHTIPFNNEIGRKAWLKRVRNVFTFDKNITVICISEAMVPIVKYIFPRNNVVTCINCIDFSRFEKRNYNRNEKFSVLLFGYNYYVKGVDVAIKAVLKVKKIISGIHLDIVMGDNLEENTNRIEREFGAVPECVSILRPTNNIKPYYQNHAVFLNASRSEGGSYAILEAYYSGALCVLSDVPATREANLPNVILFKNEDPDSLAEALIEAHRVKDTYENIADYVEGKYSIDTWSKNIMRILKIH